MSVLRESTSSSTAGRLWSINTKAMRVIVTFSGGKDSLAANWLISPFLRGAGNPSKHAATP